MASSYTPILRLTLPVTGELQGTWGDTVNNGITSLTEAAIAGTAAVVMSDADHTLTVANGATDEARRMFVTLTGTLSATRNVVCPAVSKMYVVRNNTTGGQSVVFKTAAGTGVTVANGQSAFLYCDGTNVVEAFSAFSGNLTLSGGTTNGVAYLNGSKVLTTGSALTFDGTTLGAARAIFTAADNSYATAFNATNGNLRIIPYDNNYNGTVLIAYTANYVGYGSLASDALNYRWYTSGTEQMRLTSTGLGIGTSSPGGKLEVAGNARVRDTLVMQRSSSSMYLSVLNYGNTLGGAKTDNLSFGNAGAGDILFWANGLERMRLDASGNVGIGTSSPAARLHVSGGVTRVQATSDGNDGILRVVDTAASTQMQTYATSTAGFTGVIENKPLIFLTNNTERARIDSSGNLLVGTTSNIASGYRMSLFPAGTAAGGIAWRNFEATSASNPFAAFFNSADTLIGSIICTNTATAFNTSSDYRLKDITGPVTNSGAYIDSLRPVEGTWKADGSTFVGLIAHEVQEVSRTNVATGVKDGPEIQAMDYSSAEIIANLIAEVQALRKRVAHLETA